MVLRLLKSSPLKTSRYDVLNKNVIMRNIGVHLHNLR